MGNLATLAPAFKPGYDSRRYDPANNAGKTYKPGIKTILRKVGDLPGGKINLPDGSELDLTRGEMAAYKLGRDMNDDALAPIDRQRALKMYWERRYGKEAQPLEHSGPNGKPISFASDPAQIELAFVDSFFACLDMGESLDALKAAFCSKLDALHAQYVAGKGVEILTENSQ